MLMVILAFVAAVVLSKVCQWIMTQVGFLAGPLAAFAMQKQSPFLNGVAITVSSLLRSYVALSFTTSVILVVATASRGRGIAFSLVAWTVAFFLANSPAWSSLTTFIRQFRATADDKVQQAGGPFDQARARRTLGEMYVHFSYTHHLVLAMSIIGFIALVACPPCRTAGWAWVGHLVPQSMFTHRQDDPERTLCKTAVMSFLEAHAMMSDDQSRIVQLTNAQTATMKDMIRKGVTAASQVSDAYLASVHAELPTEFRDHLVKGWKTYLDGLDSSDPALQIRGITLVQEWEAYEAKHIDHLYHSIIE